LAAAALCSAPAFADDGPDLAVAAQQSSFSCSSPTDASVQIDAAVTSRSGAPLTILVSTGGEFTVAGEVRNWSSHGRTKAAEGTVAIAVPAGVATPVTICFARPGGKPGEPREACATVVVTPACDQGSGSGLI
jgi:hypothetical protein